MRPVINTLRSYRGPSSSVRRYATGITKDVVLVDGRRTPFGKFGGSLADQSPVQLAIHAAKATLAATNVPATAVDHVIFANVVPSTADTLYAARHVGLHVGGKIETPAYNVNRLCGSGIQGIIDAQNMIRRGEAECVLVTGAESMSMIPHLTYGGRFGTRYGALQVVDLLTEALTDKYCGTPMALTAEALGENYGINRSDVDIWALESHKRAHAAQNQLKGEIAPFTLRKGTLEVDEHIRPDASLGDMNKLKSTFKKDGLVTAATASGVVDGGAAVLVTSASFAQRHQLTPLAAVGPSAVVGVDPKLMGVGPVPATRSLLSSLGLSISDIDLFEINEAFVAQVLAVAKDLQVPHDKLNVWGGATAIGHPLGASGIRLSLTLARQLNVLNKKRGVASACIGGGQGISLYLEKI